jgi:hypothetical protein
MPFMSADGAELHQREAGQLALLKQRQAMNASISTFLLET